MRSRTRVFGSVAGALGIAAFLVAGCAALPRNPAPTFDGTFNGETPDGRTVTVTFRQDADILVGEGRVAGRPFRVSGLASWHSPLLISDPRSPPRSGYATLSTNGDSLELEGVAGVDAVNLSRGGEPVSLETGPFSGTFVSTGLTPLHLRLSQGGNLVAGTGFFDGKPVAFVGRVAAPADVSGTVLFSDETRARVNGALSDGNDTLTVKGMGGPIILERR